MQTDYADPDQPDQPDAAEPDPDQGADDQRAGMEQRLQQYGFDQSILDSMTTEQLAEIVRCWPTPDNGGTEGEAMADEAQDAQADAPGRQDEPQMSERDKLIAQLVQLGQDPEQLSTMDEAALRALLDQLQSEQEAPKEQMADDCGPGMAAPNQKPRMMGDDMAATQPAGQQRLPTKVTTTQHYSERERKALARLQATESRLARIERDSIKKDRELKRGQIVAFCESMVRLGRMLPAHVPAQIELASTLDHTRAVKFSEGLTCTALERWMKGWEQSPPLVRFGELARGASRTGTAADGSDPEVEEVQRFSELQSDSLAKVGISKDQFVETFKKQRAKDPAFTAKAYIGA